MPKTSRSNCPKTENQADGVGATYVEVTIGKRTISLSNLDKVLFPRDGFTKGDLIAYYRAVAPWLLPHLRDCPLTLQRYPDGIDKQSFFEKHLPKGLPDWVERTTLTSPEGQRANTTYMVCNDEATLAFVANLASIVLHVWTSRVETIEEPDYIFFDLDPGEQCTIKTLAAVALEVRDQLAAIGLTTLVKTSGGMGLHVVVPLAAGYTYDTAKMFAELVATRLAHEDAERKSRSSVHWQNAIKRRSTSIISKSVAAKRS